MSNAMSLKAKIRNIAKQKNIPAQVILQNYMFESRSKGTARLIGIQCSILRNSLEFSLFQNTFFRR